MFLGTLIVTYFTVILRRVLCHVQITGSEYVYTLVTHHTFVVTCHKCKSIIGMFLEVESLRYYTFGFLEAQSEKSL